MLLLTKVKINALENKAMVVTTKIKPNLDLCKDQMNKQV
jgi:hypothetical protein